MDEITKIPHSDADLMKISKEDLIKYIRNLQAELNKEIISYYKSLIARSWGGTGLYYKKGSDTIRIDDSHGEYGYKYFRVDPKNSDLILSIIKPYAEENMKDLLDSIRYLNEQKEPLHIADQHRLKELEDDLKNMREMIEHAEKLNQ